MHGYTLLPRVKTKLAPIVKYNFTLTFHSRNVRLLSYGFINRCYKNSSKYESDKKYFSFELAKLSVLCTCDVAVSCSAPI